MEVLAHNADYSQTYEREVNMFSDMTNEEFEQQYGGCLVIPEEKLNGTQVSKGRDSLGTIGVILVGFPILRPFFNGRKDNQGQR